MPLEKGKSLTGIVKRARSEAQKQDRKSVILDAARAMLADSDASALTMNGLAKRAGVAKGTLYLYVKTKEEVFALLLADDVVSYVEHVSPALDTADGLSAATQAFVATHPLFLPFVARITSIIETNLSLDALVDFKRLSRDQTQALMAALQATHTMESAQALEVTLALWSTLQGAAQLCIAPNHALTDLPEDVQTFYELGTFEAAFTRLVRLIYKGAGLA